MLSFLAKKALEKVVTDGEYADLVARGFRSLHTALKREGFSEEQATVIVAGQGLAFLFPQS